MTVGLYHIHCGDVKSFGQSFEIIDYFHPCCISMQDKRTYLDIISRSFDIHATIGNTTQKKQDYNMSILPGFVYNHGILKASELQDLLKVCPYLSQLYMMHTHVPMDPCTFSLFVYVSLPLSLSLSLLIFFGFALILIPALLSLLFPFLLPYLQETKVFVGLGFPYEGPAPLEAIASGCFFLNPRIDPQRKTNTKITFFTEPLY